MTSIITPNPVVAPQHIHDLLYHLHQESLEQEASLTSDDGNKIFSSTVLKKLREDPDASNAEKLDAQIRFDRLMIDKFIALDQDKCQFVYSLILSMDATNVVEAGTSFGVSTIYLSLAVGQNIALTGKSGTVIATENQVEKTVIAERYWQRCGDEVVRNIDLRVGDLRKTLQKDMPTIDLLLLDIWSMMALPALKLVQPHLRPGAVVLIDNTISGASGYADLFAYMRSPENGFRNMTLPFTNGLGMSVYIPV